MRRANILFLYPGTEGSGGEEFSFPLISYLDKKRYAFSAALRGQGRLSRRLESLGVRVFLVPLRPLKAKNPFPFIRTVFALWRLFKREHIDVVITSSVLSNQYGIFAAKLAGIPIICAVQNLRGKRAINRTFAKFADRVIVVSKAVEELMIKNGIAKHKIRLIYNPIEMDNYIPSKQAGSDFRREFGLAEDHFVIGIIGRIMSWKGHHVIIEALAHIAQSEEKARLLIVGDLSSPDPDMWERDYLEKIKEQISRLQLEEKVIFTGYRSDVWNAFNAIDVLALPSNVEPAGRVVIEAMAMEKPVVATNAGGPPEVVVDGVTGFLVPLEQPLAFASRILTLAQDRELAHNMGKKGRERVEKLFTKEIAGQQLEMLFDQLLKERLKET